MSRADATANSLDFIVAYAGHLRRAVPDAKAVIRNRINRIDGHTTGTDAPKVSHTAELTTVEAAAARRIRLVGDLTDLDDRLDTTVKVLRALLNDCRRIIGDRAEVPRCDGGVGYEGYLHPRQDGGWSYPDCTNVPDEGRKTCARCRQAASRWKRERERCA